MLARCLDQVPADVPAGLHLCYGDPGHKHPVEPESMELQVNLITACSRRVPATVMGLVTVPQDRSDAGFFSRASSRPAVRGLRSFRLQGGPHWRPVEGRVFSVKSGAGARIRNCQ